MGVRALKSLLLLRGSISVRRGPLPRVLLVRVTVPREEALVRSVVPRDGVVRLTVPREEALVRSVVPREGVVRLTVPRVFGVRVAMVSRDREVLSPRSIRAGVLVARTGLPRLARA